MQGFVLPEFFFSIVNAVTGKHTINPNVGNLGCHVNTRKSENIHICHFAQAIIISFCFHISFVYNYINVSSLISNLEHSFHFAFSPVDKFHYKIDFHSKCQLQPSWIQERWWLKLKLQRGFLSYAYTWLIT